MAVTGAGPPSGTVLVLRDLGLGDALTAVPALRGLRRAHPRRRLVLAGPPAIGTWFRALGLVDAAVPCHHLVPQWPHPPPDLAVNLHGQGPQSHRALQSLSPHRLLAFRNLEAGHDRGPAWPAQRHEVDRWCELVHTEGAVCGPQDLRLGSGRPDPESHVVLHPGAAAASRRWPADRWVTVARHLSERGIPVVVTGSAAEAGLCAAVARAHPAVRDLSGRLGLEQLTALVARARLLLCGDTGVAHLATATGTPSVVLFGPVAPSRWGPRIDPDRHVVIWRPGAQDPPGDPHGDRLDPRLARIDVPTVLTAAAMVLDRGSAGLELDRPEPVHGP